MPPNLRGQTIFITGGAGFIGSSLSQQLVQHNRVIIYDNGHRGRLSLGLLRHPRVRYVQGDVLDLPGLCRAMDGATHVVHLASIAGVDTVIKMPVDTMRIAFIGTYNVLEAALRQKKIKRFIDYSTSEVFGQYAYKISEASATSLGAVGEARWTYAGGKLASEHLTHTYFQSKGLPTLSIRPFNIYGPGQVGEGAIHRFVVRALRGETLEIHNDGSQIRAWCYVDDIVRATLSALHEPKAIGQVFNIGNPRSAVTIYNLAQLIVALSGSRSRIRFVSHPGPDVELRIPSIEKARQLLKYEPAYELEDGLRHTIHWYRQEMRKK